MIRKTKVGLASWRHHLLTESVDSLTIAKLKQGANETPQEAFFQAQVQDRSERTTKSGSPYLELTLTDAVGRLEHARHKRAAAEEHTV